VVLHPKDPGGFDFARNIFASDPADNDDIELYRSFKARKKRDVENTTFASRIRSSCWQFHDFTTATCHDGGTLGEVECTVAGMEREWAQMQIKMMDSDQPPFVPEDATLDDEIANDTLVINCDNANDRFTCYYDEPVDHNMTINCDTHGLTPCMRTIPIDGTTNTYEADFVNHDEGLFDVRFEITATVVPQGRLRCAVRRCR
jgi:hypothetical protein